MTITAVATAAKSFRVDDLVWVSNYQGVTVPGLITGIHNYGDDVSYDVDTIPAGVVTVGVEDVRPIGAPRPATGQRWQCLSRPELVLTVESVERGGLLASCTTPSGTLTTVILFGHYEPVEVP